MKNILLIIIYFSKLNHLFNIFNIGIEDNNLNDDN
jgi:hypothetical protein